MGNVIEGLEPAKVWQLFAGLATVPRPSKREERARDHVQKLAQDHGFATRLDAAGNLIVSVPATTGFENAPLTVIQGHLDMVCEKNSGTTHDFDNDPIELILDEDAEGEQIVRANGTTLGADNGIGVVLGFAAAISDDVVHGPLELLMTLDEEAGMSGAKGLTPESINGRRLLNLDSEEDDAIYIGCAGGCDTNLQWSFDTVAPPPGSSCFDIQVNGLRGGHSGCDIHEGRGSAIKLLARLLLESGAGGTCLAMVDGGSMRNAIPREASATVFCSAEIGAALQGQAGIVQQQAIEESLEPDACIKVTPRGDPVPDQCVSNDESAKVLRALAALPHGVLGMHPKVAGLVETSNNIATIKMESGGGHATVSVGTLSRSSSQSRLAETLRHIDSVGALSSATSEHGNDYPGWDPNPDSALLASCRRLYREMFGEDAQVMAIHAGLECGLIGERVGRMDMVSFGPRIEGAHSPDERVYVASVAKTWNYLKAVLAELAKG
ncbi:MAG: beta-Ala-His dipeptidase [Planctomycetota bacterium]|jgi:dipeptidase D